MDLTGTMSKGAINGHSHSQRQSLGFPTSVMRALDQGAILADVQNVCPDGTRAWMLCLGYLEGDEGHLLRGGNQSLDSTKNEQRANKRRSLPMYCVLIEHPHEGLVLWETGAGMVSPELQMLASQYRR